MPASSQGFPTSGIRETRAPHFWHRILIASIQGRCGEWPANRSHPSTARSRSSCSLQVFPDGRPHLVDMPSRQPAVRLREDAKLVDGGQDREAMLLAEREVLRAASGGDVHEPGPLLRADVAPGDDTVLDALLRRQI